MERARFEPRTSLIETSDPIYILVVNNLYFLDNKDTKKKKLPAASTAQPISSLPSWQSLSLSHLHRVGIQCLFPHRNSEEMHVRSPGKFNSNFDDKQRKDDIEYSPRSFIRYSNIVKDKMITKISKETDTRIGKTFITTSNNQS